MTHSAGGDRQPRFIRWFETLGSNDTALVGGKNASLGEMIQRLEQEGVRVPGGFAVTVEGYWHFVDHNSLRERLTAELQDIRGDSPELPKRGSKVRELIRGGTMPDDLDAEIREAFVLLQNRATGATKSVAARSSATAEDLPGASFAGQQETYLNIGSADALVKACKDCFASLFTDRAIAYRENNGFDHMKVGLSVGVQQMVDASRGSAGVMFSIDTETGFPRVVVINSAWGLGEPVVKGSISPDEFTVFKPLLEQDVDPILSRRTGSKQHKMVFGRGTEQTTREKDTSKREQRSFSIEDGDVKQLARWAVAIERHYGMAMDMEWAKDGETGDLYIVQARPETVEAMASTNTVTSYTLREEPEPLLTGQAIGRGVATGHPRVLLDIRKGDSFERGDVLVTDMTSPDWVPLMKRASAIVTDYGGRTSHAAIVSRELGVPAVIGTDTATNDLAKLKEVTVSCAEGHAGHVYQGAVPFDRHETELGNLPRTRTEIMMNVASPDGAFQWWRLPFAGIGLARMEFIINNEIGIHPMALLQPDRVGRKDRERIQKMTEGYGEPGDYFIERLAQGIATIAASVYPEPAIVRLSDFKTNEYAHLLGGEAFEPEEENPMLGFRGAFRYTHERYREAFALECAALRRVRAEHGLTNVAVMVPFCRKPSEADSVIEAMAANGLIRGANGLQLYMMVEVPSNIVLAAEFAERFDGFSIGSNDLTQMVLGIERDSDLLRAAFDENDPAVVKMIQQLIDVAHEKRVKVGLCGQAPSDNPDFAAVLVEAGIDSISVNPDSAVDVWKVVAEAERKLAA